MKRRKDKPNLVWDSLLIAYTEDSLASRKQRVRGTGTLKQVETCLVLSSKKLTLPVRTRKHFQGSSNGDLLLGVEWPKLAEEWHVKWQEKKEMLGKKHLVPVGGKTADDAGDRTSNRAANELEPMCYHSLPLAFYEEILHGYYAKMVVDMTPSDARFAWACLRTRTGYVGICFTEAHVRGLENRLLELLKEDVVDPNSPLFSAAYSEAVGLKKTPSQGSGGPDPKAKPQAKPKGRGRGRGGPKPKPKTKPKAKPKSAPTAPDDGEEGPHCR